MSEDKVYKDGDIVWVKLGNSWWPGEVIGDEKRLPDDVHQFKKPPYCVVKFFQEDAYEYPKNAKQVYPFQCPKKDEFIKKGLTLYNAKKSFMEKFPDDVKHAERLTEAINTSMTRIINDRPGGLVKEMWGHGLTRRSIDYYENSHRNVSNNGGESTHNHGTTRRDSVTTILNITPNRASISAISHTSPSKSATSTRTLSTSSSASVTPNTTASNQYRCNMCEFATMRQNVLIMHRKSHSSSGKSVTKPLTTPAQSGSATLNSSMQEDLLNNTAKSVVDNASCSSSTPLTTKRADKSRTVDSEVEKKTVELPATEVIKSSRTRKKASSASPSPKVLTTKRTLRNSPAVAQQVSPTIVASDAAAAETEKIIKGDDDESSTSNPHNTGTVSPTDSKNSEHIRQRLLADWSDEEKDENHDTAPTTSHKHKSPKTVQESHAANVTMNSAIKRRSPTIVPMKTLEGAGQTLVVASSTQSSIVKEIIARTAQRIRNIPKKDRLRDFSNISTVEVQPKLGDVVSNTMVSPKATAEKAKSPNNSPQKAESEAASGTTNTPSATLSCFDFQEEEEENDVLKSIANYKKKYFSPDKDKLNQSASNNEHTSTQKVCATEQRYQDLSAEIDKLLEQTSVLPHTLKEDAIGTASVKGLPIKERGKRIFKSRNRARIDDDGNDGTPVDPSTKQTEALSCETPVVQEELKDIAATSPSISERKTRGSSKRTRGKNDQNSTTSPINGNAGKNKPSEHVAVESPSVTENVQSVRGMAHVSQTSRRKPYNNRIMRQVIEEEETSIPFIRHSPVEIYSCDSSLDNGTHVVRGRRSKTTTPNSLTHAREEVGNDGSRSSSRSMNAAPLTPTDETSSLGVSDAGAEFGSPASSLDEERLLTPVQDATDNQNANEFEPINENRIHHELPAESNDVLEEDEEIESPPHEALSGNELEEHELKEGTKRLKSPKKKSHTKEQHQTTNFSTESSLDNEKRKLRAETASPGSDGLPKRLTRGALQQCKELSEDIQEPGVSTPTRTRSIRGSPASVELKQRTTGRRSTPTRVSSRHATATKTAADADKVTSESPRVEVSESHSDLIDNTGAEDNANSAKDDIEVRSAEESKDTAVRPVQHRKLKARRSKTPALDTETEKQPTKEIDGMHIQEHSETKTAEGLEEAPQEKSILNDHDLEEKKLVSSASEKNIDTSDQKSIKDITTVENKHTDKSDTLSEKRSVSAESSTEINLCEKLSPTRFQQSPVAKSLRSNTPSASPNKEVSSESPDKTLSGTHSPSGLNKHSPRVTSPRSAESSMNSVEKLSRRDSPNTADNKLSPRSVNEKPSSAESAHSTSKMLSSTDSTRNSDKKQSPTDILSSPDKELFRTGSPQSSDKKLSSPATQKNADKNLFPAISPPNTDNSLPTDLQQDKDKQVTRTDTLHNANKDHTPHSSTKKSSRWDSPHNSDKRSSNIDPICASDKKPLPADLQSTEKKFSRWDSQHSPVKKPTRWDSPSHVGKIKKSENSNSATKSGADEQNLAVTERSMQPEDSEKNASLKSKATGVDGNGTVNATDNSSLQLAKQNTTKASTVDSINTSTSTSTALMTTSPTVEKVRINVDVANPLSTQIANILAASGSSIQNQQLQLSRNKSPKSNNSSPLKRKHSLDETNVVGTIGADGDAVVAHVQSLCPQVKITRKERIIPTAVESAITSPKKSTVPQNTSGNYDISQMPIVISNEQISAPKKSPKNTVSSSSVLSASNLWQTDLLQPPTTPTTLTPTSDSQASQLSATVTSEQPKIFSSPIHSTSGERNSSVNSRLTQSPRSSQQSLSPQKSPAAATGGRKQVGNTVALPSSIAMKQHKFVEALALADSVLAPSAKPTKRRSSQTTPSSTAGNGNLNRRLSSAPALDVRSSPSPAKVPKMSANVEQTKASPIKTQTENNSMGKTWSQSHQQTLKQKKVDPPNAEIAEHVAETTAQPADSASPAKSENTIDEIENVTDVEQLNSTAKITAVPIQPIPGYDEPFMLCMLVDNMYKPINNIPHYLNTDLNQLVPVPPEAYQGMLPELAVDQPPAPSTDGEAATDSSTLSSSALDQRTNQMRATNQQRHMSSAVHKSQSLLATRELGDSSIYSDGSTTDEAFKLVLQTGDSALADAGVADDQDMTDGTAEGANDNAVVLNLENQQIILDAATFEQLLANPDANTQLVTDDGTEFVLTREVLAALKAQHDGQNVELLAIPTDQQQLPEQLIGSGGISEAGSSADLLSVALASSEFYGNDVLQIETTLGAGASAAGLQLLASDGSIVFQAPPLPQAHLTPPITAHTSETNAVLNQTPIMSTLEKPSTAVVGGKNAIESPTAAVVAAVECNVPGMRPNLDDSLAVIGVTTQSSTVPTSLELPITITNPAIAPKVTMAQSGHGADLVQFQPHRSVATVTAAAANIAHIYDDPIEGIN